MQRPQITTLALPRSDTWPLASQGQNDLLPPHEAPFHFLPDVQDFAKFMLATPEQYILDITREIADLDEEERSLALAGDEFSITFVARAREKCFGMLAKAQEMELDASLQRTMEKKRKGLEEALARARARRRRELVTPVPGSDEDIVEDDASVPSAMLSSQSPSVTFPPSSKASRNKRNVNPPPHSSSTYHFYQATSGASIFLHPLDIRILLSHFGSYPSFPDSISVLVMTASESTVDDDLRRRCKYLAHLPEGADVVFVEADLESVVGAEALKPFESLLKVRTARRKERAKKDEKARVKAEERERESLFSTLAGARIPEGEAPIWDERADSPPPIEGIEMPVATPTPARLPLSGAWGTRSFASAANSGPTARTPGTQRNSREEANEADWEYDQAWHELEEAQLARGASSGGKRSRQKKLVLVGGVGRRG